MNVLNSVKENFGSAEEKWNNMTIYNKVSMFIGLLSATFLMVLLGLKKLGGNDLLKVFLTKMGADGFVFLVALILVTMGTLQWF